MNRWAIFGRPCGTRAMLFPPRDIATTPYWRRFMGREQVPMEQGTLHEPDRGAMGGTSFWWRPSNHALFGITRQRTGRARSGQPK